MATDLANTSLLDRLADRIGYQRKAAGVSGAQVAIARQGAASIPDYALANNQLKTYEVFSAIYSAVRMIAEPASLVPLTVQEFDGEEKTAVANHDFEKLMRRPNHIHTGIGLLETTIAHLELTGNAYWNIVADGAGKPYELWPMRPDRVKPVPHATEYLAGYLYEVDGLSIPFDVNEVVHFKRFHPRNDYIGMSTISSLAYQLEGEQGMIRFNTNFFSKGRAVPAGILNSKEFIADGDFERLKKDFYSNYGGAERRTLVTRGGSLEWINVGLSQADMQFLEGRAFTLDEVMRAFGIPAGKYRENATEANAKVAGETFKSETLWPKLVAVAARITHSLIMPAYGDEFIAEFEDIRPEDKEALRQEWSAVAQGTVGPSGMRVPIMSPDEMRERYFGMDPLAWDALDEPASEPDGQQDEDQPGSPGEMDDEGDLDEDMGQDTVAGRRADALDKWKRKSLNAMRRGKTADVVFETDAVPAHERIVIHEALAQAQTAQEVKAAFSGPFCHGHDWEGYP